MELMRAIWMEWIKVMRSGMFRGALIFAAVIVLMITMYVKVPDSRSDWSPLVFVGVNIALQMMHVYDLIAIMFAATYMAKEIRNGAVVPCLARLSRRWKLYAAKWISIASSLAIVIAALTLFSLVIWFLRQGTMPLASRPDNLLKLMGLMLLMIMPGSLLVMSAVMLIGQFTGRDGAVAGGIVFVAALDLLYYQVPVVRDYLPIKPMDLEGEPYISLMLMALYIAVVTAAGFLVFGRRDFAVEPPDDV